MRGDSDPRKPLKLIKVGVFPPDEGSRTYMAYTRWYNPQWPRCCEHEVEAVNGTEAKKIAIQDHKERCESDLAMPDKQQIVLTDEQITEVETLAALKSLSYTDVDKVLDQVPALCQTVRALRAENKRLRNTLEMEGVEVE